MGNKVFIVCEPTTKREGEIVKAVDLTPAALWGEPVVLLPLQQSLIAPCQTIKNLQSKLSSFCDEDFLVPIGDPALMCVAAMVAGQANNGRIKMLKWDRKLGVYFPIQVDLNSEVTKV